MSVLVDKDIKKYIGKPYDQYNCLDLVKEFYKDFFHLSVKNYYEGSTPDRKEVSSLINTNRGDFEQITGKKKFGDLVVIKLYGIECHLGVVLDENTFLHSSRGIGSHIERISRYKNLISGFYRHREQTA